MSLEAAADTGYYFKEWSGTCVDAGMVENPHKAITTIIVEEDCKLIANFEPFPLLKISSTNGGVVANPGEGAFPYDYNEVVTLRAVADTGYIFEKWTGPCVDAGMIEGIGKAFITITIEGDCELMANFEPSPFMTVYVPDNYATIQAAIDASGDGLTIIVREGTYIENINFLGKAITVKSTDPNDPEVVANTIINGNQVGSVVTFTNGEGPTCGLKGMTISNGSSSNGGGIYCDSSSPIITNCTISDNIADDNGGGIFCAGSSSPTITNCTICGNTATHYDGGGIYCRSSSLTITNCTICGNMATYSGGGGIYCASSSSPTITNCTICGNTATHYDGGGIYCRSSSLTITNCTICGNMATYSGGGGIYCASLDSHVSFLS